MTNETTVDWAERDQAARNALNVICDDPGEVKQGWLEVRLRGELVGRVSFYSENDWLVETIEIKVFEAYRFRKEVYAGRWSTPSSAGRVRAAVPPATVLQIRGMHLRSRPYAGTGRVEDTAGCLALRRSGGTPTCVRQPPSRQPLDGTGGTATQRFASGRIRDMTRAVAELETGGADCRYVTSEG